MGFTKLGSEIYVNTTTAGDQIDPQVIELLNGDVVVAWTDLSQVAGVNSADIRGQRLGSGGTALSSSEFILNTTRSSSQSDVALTALGDGGFAAAWTSYAALPGNADLPWELESGAFQTHAVSQVFTASAVKSGGETTHYLPGTAYPTEFNVRAGIGGNLALLDSHEQFHPALTADLSSGGSDFALAVVEELRLANDYFIPLPPFVVTQDVGMNNIAMFGGPTSFLVEQEEEVTWDSATEIFSNDFELTDSFSNPVMITLSDGDIVTAYERLHFPTDLVPIIKLSNKLYVDIEGVSDPINVGSTWAENPALAELENGNIVVVWEDTAAIAPDPNSILGQLISPSGTKIGGEFTIDTSSDEVETPSVAALADGRFVVVWVNPDGDGSGTSLKAQIYTADAVKSGKEFVVNTVTSDDQITPAVVGLSNGNFIVTWTSTDGATADIKSQVFDPRVYTGDSSNDAVYGGDDDDQLTGGDGTDRLYGGEGNDTFEAVTRDDLDDGDIFSGDGGVDTLVFDDIIFDWGGPPVLLGGNRTITGVEIFELADGLNNIELAIPLANSSSTGNVTVYGGSGQDFINGDRIANSDVSLFLNGNEGDDQLFGGAGSDTLSGGEGDDWMEGGAGDDIYIVDSIGDTVTEGLALFDSNDLVISFIDYTLDFYLENLALSGSANLVGTGNVHDNVLIGNSGSNGLYGLEGDDTLYGEDGHDELDGGTGTDTMKGGAGDDVYYVDNFSDVVDELADEGEADWIISSMSIGLPAYVEKLLLTGTANLYGVGNLRDNIMTGNSGSNALTGVLGADSLYGAGGNDVLWGGQGGDLLNGGTDIDTAIYTGSSAFVHVMLGTGGLVFGGDATGDTLTSIENLVGSAYDDILIGFTGTNVLSGGEGMSRLMLN